MSMELIGPLGVITVADEELTLSFNNNTIAWGMDAYTEGMTTDEFKQALIERLFDEDFADIFIKKMWWQVGLK